MGEAVLEVLHTKSQDRLRYRTFHGEAVLSGEIASAKIPQFSVKNHTFLFFPGKARFSKMPIGGNKVIIHIQQMQTADDAFGRQVVILPYKGFKKSLILMLRAEGFHIDADRLRHTDGVGNLNLAFVRVSGSHDIHRNLAGGIGSGTVNLAGIFPAHRTAADVADTAIGIAGQLPAGHTAIGKAPTDHEAAGRIDQLFKVRVQAKQRQPTP